MDGAGVERVLTLDLHSEQIQGFFGVPVDNVFGSPVLLGDVSITEEAFDPHLRPIRARVGLELRVLTTNDLAVTHLGGTLYLKYRQNVEQLAAKVQTTAVAPLGLEQVP